ncbi:ThiF family adenylyltransferase [uncultured Pseudokineococcus sp.]|uniref:ThiF family adenylyltransferase n=1 Tax=uncultured Pseudokineococcus sp. TaxID=1642928 RepID=UPI0026212E8C|nr:ThiF family adenylyltransferase [uncultured Pseudokineococcus sp.]
MSSPSQRVPPLVEPGPPLTDDERRRYARQTVLPEVGEEGQRRLRAARVLVVGAGGLGSPVLLYLAAAGVGTLGVVDDDVVDVSNLHRQVLHGVADVERPKTESAADALARLDPGVQVVQHAERLTAGNALELLAGYDLVVDASDGTATRYLLDDACGLAGVPCVWGSVLGLAGQVSTSWVPYAPEDTDGLAGHDGAHGPGAAGVHGPCYRDVFPEPPESAPSCAEAGVLGSVCAVVGSVMATEALKLLTGTGDPLVGRVLLVDAGGAMWRTLRVVRDPSRLPPMDLAEHEDAAPGAEVDVAGLRAALAEDPAGTLVLDVREPSEHAAGVVPGSVLLPLGRVLAGERPDLAGREQVVVVCAAGARSAQAAQALREDGSAAVSLRGGLQRWDGELVPPSPEDR